MTDFVNSVGFKEAMEYAASRKVVLPDDYYGKLVGIQRAQSVSVAGLAALEQIRFVIDKLADVLEKGGTFKSFQDAVRVGGLDINLPTHRLENIFRTNIQAAYSRGRWEQQTRSRGTRPYLMYDAINDSRTRPAHAAMDNIIRRWDDPFWATNYPTNGYRCRCTVISLTEAQAKKRGGPTDPMPDPETTRPDPGWDYNPGADYASGPNLAIEKTTEKIKRRSLTAAQKADRARKKLEAEQAAAGPATLDEVMEIGHAALADLPTDPIEFNEAFERLLLERVIKSGYGSDAANKAAVAKHARTALKKTSFKTLYVANSGYSKEEYLEAFFQALPLPKSWLKATSERYRTIMLQHAKDRAYADQENGLLNINIDKTDVVLHEFLHLVQVAFPEVQTMVRELHLKRTAGSNLNRMRDLTGNPGYDVTELTREDKYFNPYMGKEYNTNLNGRPAPNEPLEVLTMTLQALIGSVGGLPGKVGANSMRNALLSKDKESAAFALGLLLRYA